MNIQIKKYLLYCFVIYIHFVLASCRNNNEAAHLIVKKNFYTDGKLKQKITFNKDLMFDGLTTFYYDNNDGSIQTEVIYKNGKKEGFEKEYYENGKLQVIGKNTNDKQDSTWTWYYENGDIQQIDNYANGLTIGTDYTYYPNNKIMLFEFCDYKGIFTIENMTV